MTTTSSLAYHEPPITIILILASFLLLLNITNDIGNKLLYCGLIGQILVGVAWGTPGTDWLSPAVQHAVMQLGYLGLILMVYEGGLATNVKALRANLLLSTLVAAIGISCPIALSFILIRTMKITPLQAFAAGAALCSTSLGTTFTVLTTSGLSESRLGVVLSSAAMMDDVVGLIMVQVVSNLGQASSSLDAITIVRPVLVSLAFAILLPVACRWIVRPLVLLDVKSPGWMLKLVTLQQLTFLLSTMALLAMVTGSSYAGTSNLFAAYLTGLAATWYDDLISNRSQGQREPTTLQQADTAADSSEEAVASHSEHTRPEQNALPTPPVVNSIDDLQSTRHGDELRTLDQSTRSCKPSTDNALTYKHTIEPPTTSLPRITAKTVYEIFYGPAVEAILKPFFFASIGFSIPITQMFSGNIVWRGLVYATLMALGKLLCGVCLFRLNMSMPNVSSIRTMTPSRIVSCWTRPHDKQEHSSTRSRATATHTDQERRIIQTAPKNSKSPKPLSIYPAAMLGTAMVARGEIGFLISSVAESTGIYGASGDDATSELFLVVTWAILICTILGPLVVGMLTKRVKRLQETDRRKGNQSGKVDPLGIWGVVGDS